MADQDEAVTNQTGEVETPIESSPDTDEQTLQQEEAPIEESQVETQEETTGDTRMTAEQARAFQEMRQEIKHLKEERDGKRKRESAFDSLRPSYTPQEITQGQTEVDINNYIDPTTGEFQAHKYNQEVNRAIQQAQALASQQATLASQQAVDERLAREKFPQLDPSSDQFDSEFENRVASQYFYEYYQGKNPSIVELAQKELKTTVKQARQIEKQTAEATRQQLNRKEQAGISAAGSSQPGISSSQELESLRVRTRHGDHWATAQRLRNVRE